MIAQELERAARQRQATEVDALPPKSGRRSVGQFTQNEIARLVTLSPRTIREIEKRAIRKLMRHPGLRALWREWTGNVSEAAVPAGGGCQLSEMEMTAVYSLARNPAELSPLRP